MLAGLPAAEKRRCSSILGCVLTATDGSVKLFGETITGRREKELPALRLSRIGFIFQGNNLIASLSARENVALPLQMRGVSGSQSLALADQLLERVGLGDKTKALPSQLSGGQRQRVAIARAIAREIRRSSWPMSPRRALDAHSGLLVTTLLRDLCRERGDTVIVVTHDSSIFSFSGIESSTSKMDSSRRRSEAAS